VSKLTEPLSTVSKARQRKIQLSRFDGGYQDATDRAYGLGEAQFSNQARGKRFDSIESGLPAALASETRGQMVTLGSLPREVAATRFPFLAAKEKSYERKNKLCRASCL
jgi:hypothetical protein